MTSPLSIEQRLKTHAHDIRKRLMNPKNGRQEPKVVRTTEKIEISIDKPIRKGFSEGTDPVTVSHIRSAYQSGIPINTICERFHISSRTLRRLRQKEEWPIREKIR